jgi:hypothetical protein
MHFQDSIPCFLGAKGEGNQVRVHRVPDPEEGVLAHRSSKPGFDGFQRREVAFMEETVSAADHGREGFVVAVDCGGDSGDVVGSDGEGLDVGDDKGGGFCEKVWREWSRLETMEKRDCE